MIPAIIAPAFIIPPYKLDARHLWADWDGSLDGVFQDVTTYGGNPGSLAVNEGAFYDVALNRGFVHEGGNNGLVQMFRLADPMNAERFGDQINMAERWRGEGYFTADSSRIWMPQIKESDSPRTMRVRFAEYDTSGLVQMSSAITDAVTETINTSYRSIISELDSTRALWAFLEENTAGSKGTRVAVLQRSGGTLLTTVNSIDFGVGVGTGGTDFEGARPLKTDRSIVTFPTNISAPFTIDVQGVAHAGTIPSSTGSASTLTTNAAVGFGFGSSAPYGRLSQCLDGYGNSQGRFIFSWIDHTNGDIQLRCIHYDGTTITLGTTLDTNLSPSGNDYDLEVLGGGAVLLLHNADPTTGSGGFRIIEYDPVVVTNTDLAMSALGLGQVAKDGFLTGHPTNGNAYAFAISQHRFGIALGNSFDGSVCVKVVHNGGDAIV